MSDAHVISLLESIDRSLKGLLAQGRTASAGGGGAVAPDSDLDSKYGDPKINFDPRDWSEKGGESYKGKRYSEAPAEFLLAYAKAKDYFGQRAEDNGELASNGKPKAQYERKDAARARGWAKRNQGGVKAPAAQDPAEGGESWPNDNDDDLPF